MLSDTYTEADIERAARILCKMCHVQPYDRPSFDSSTTWGAWHRERIERALRIPPDIESALKQAAAEFARGRK